MLQYHNKTECSKQQTIENRPCKDIMKKLLSQNLVPTKITINIENVVATSFLNHKINIQKIIKNYPLAKYEPKKFPGAVIRQNQSKSVIMIFKSGSIVCTGTKSIEMALNTIRRFVLEIKISQKLDDLCNSEIKIENMVASCDLGRRIHLEQAAKTLPRSLYEPEQFPGIIHRLSYPSTVVLVFASGRIVCVGAKSSQDIDLSLNTLQLDLESRNLIALE